MRLDMNRRKTIERRNRFRFFVGQTQNRRVHLRRSESVWTLRTILHTLTSFSFLVLKGLAVAGALALVGVGVYFSYQHISTSTYFDIKQIEIHGISHAPKSEILNLLKDIKGKMILRVDNNELEKMLITHPWIRKAKVNRILPDTLIVDIDEQQAEALIQLGHIYLVNEAGEVFKRALSYEMADLPLITGISRLSFLEGAKKAQNRIQKALTALRYYQKENRPQVGKINIGQSDEITFFLKTNKVEFHFGSEITDDRLAKLDAVWTALGPRINSAQALFFDNEMRTNRVVVRMSKDEQGE